MPRRRCSPPPRCTCACNCSGGGFGGDEANSSGVKCSEFCNICDTNGSGSTRNLCGGADSGSTQNICNINGGGSTQNTHIKLRFGNLSPESDRCVSPPRQTINVSPPRQIICSTFPQCSCPHACQTTSSSKSNCSSQTVQRGRRRSRNKTTSKTSLRFDTPERINFKTPSPDRCSISPIGMIRQNSCSPQPAHRSCSPQPAHRSCSPQPAHRSCSPQPAHRSCSRTVICVSPAYCLTNRCRSCSVSPLRHRQRSECSPVRQTEVTQVRVTPVRQTRRESVSPVRRTKTRATSVYIHSPVPSPTPNPLPARCPPSYSTGLIMPVSQSSYPVCQTNQQHLVSQNELTSIQHLAPDTDAHVCSSSSCPIQCTATIRRRSVSPVRQTRATLTRCSSVSPIRNVRFSRQISISPSPIATTTSSSRRRHKSSKNKVRYSCLAGRTICSGKYCFCGFSNNRLMGSTKIDRSISSSRIIRPNTTVSQSPLQLNAYQYSGDLACTTGTHGATFGYGTDVAAADFACSSHSAKKSCCSTCSVGGTANTGGCTIFTGTTGTRSRCTSGTSYISQRTESECDQC